VAIEIGPRGIFGRRTDTGGNIGGINPAGRQKNALEEEGSPYIAKYEKLMPSVKTWESLEEEIQEEHGKNTGRRSIGRRRKRKRRTGALWQGFLPLRLFSPVSVIPPKFHLHSSTTHAV
jgi:hypothetical protein